MTWSRDNFASGYVVLDASAVINLLGCSQSEAILRSASVLTLIDPHVLAEITRHPIETRDHEEELRDLQFKELVQVHELTETEYETYLEIVSRPKPDALGRGESAAIAVALHGKHTLVLDDRKARRITSVHYPEVNIITSLSFIIGSARQANWPKIKLKETVRAALDNARMAVLADERKVLSEVMATE